MGANAAISQFRELQTDLEDTFLAITRAEQSRNGEQLSAQDTETENGAQPSPENEVPSTAESGDRE